ncbi:MAG: thrombospondin type-1 domain-containing protein [Patescibacteria group bacterium]
MTLKKQLLNIVPLVLLLCGLFAYNFMDAQWSGPTGAVPPEQNTPAPINIGGIYQSKLGDLGAIRMRAGAYCNADGTICTTADQLGGGGGDDGGDTITVGGRCFQPALMVSCMWNWSGDGNDTASYMTYNLSNPQSACANVGRSYSSHTMILAQCANTVFSWVASGWSACVVTNRPSCGFSYGTQTRTISCRNAAGAVVADSNCTAPRPATSQSCSGGYAGSCSDN